MDAVGSFWLADESEAPLYGQVSLTESGPSIKVVGDLTCDEDDEDETTGTLRPVVIHGALTDSAENVTLLGMTTYTRRGLPFLGRSSHQMRGTLCITGSHVLDAVQTFPKVRARFNVLEEWANLFRPVSGWDEANRELNLSWSVLPDVTLESGSPKGLLSLRTLSPRLQINDSKAILQSEVWLEWEPADGTSLDDAFQLFVLPMKHFFTVNYGEECFLEGLAVFDPDANGWSRVTGRGIEPGRPVSKNAPMLPKRKIGLEGLAGWLRVSQSLHPIPQILGATFAGKTSYQELQVLELCSAAEGLHRKLHRQDKKMSQADADAAEAVLLEAASELSVEVRRSLQGMLSNFTEPSFKHRMRTLADSVSDIAPDIYGDLDEWISLVGKLRNVNAHFLGGKSVSDEKSKQSFMVVQSLKWLITVKLLQESGISVESIRKSITGSTDFLMLVYRGRQYAPQVYGAPVLLADDDEYRRDMVAH